jgi:LacI family transcriptional regulator
VKLDDPPSAIFCSNDLMAIGAMRAAADMGVQIPETVSIVGFDDIRLAAFVDPRLTTIHQPIDRVGKTAAELLLRLLSGQEDHPQQVTLQPELVVRKSCSALTTGSRII